jgi:hypothetical protein
MMTNKLSIFAATVGLTCGLIACGSSGEAAPAQTSDPAAPTANTPAPTGAAGAAAAQPGTTVTPGAAPTGTAAPSAPATPNGAAPAANTGTTPANGAPTTDPAAPTAPTAGTTPSTPTTMDPAVADHTGDIRGRCGLKTNYADDNACLIPPDPAEGMQIHIGPSNYDDPNEVAKFIMKPGEESSECFSIRTPNTEKVTYQTYTLSGRAGTHHMINTLYSGDLPTGSFGACGGFAADPNMPEAPAPVGSLPGMSKAFMPRSKVAPEYAHVGRVLEANSLLQGDMHYFNFTDKDILREVWINLYYAPAEANITTFSDQIRGFGGLGWNFEPIQPGTDMVYKYECPIMGNGKIMSLLGHYHAHGKQFTASIKRKSTGMVEKVFEMFDYLDPATFDYDSVTMNPAFAPGVAGATSGILEVQDGDVLQWDCHIINDSMAPLSYTNEVKTGEMCNVWGYSIDTTAPITCDIF